MRVVLDTNVLARAASGPPGLANQLVLICTEFVHQIILSPFIIAELGRVLRYERLRAVHGLADAQIDAYVGNLLAVADLVFPAPDSPRIVLPDPLDDAIVATAVAGGAQVLCTLDRHFYRAEVIEYCSQYGVAVLTDRQLLDQLAPN